MNILQYAIAHFRTRFPCDSVVRSCQQKIVTRISCAISHDNPVRNRTAVNALSHGHPVRNRTPITNISHESLMRNVTFQHVFRTSISCDSPVRFPPCGFLENSRTKFSSRFFVDNSARETPLSHGTPVRFFTKFPAVL